jgi:hypothetical protein
VIACKGMIPFERGFSHTLQLRIGRAVEALQVRKGLRKIRLGEPEEFFLIEFFHRPQNVNRKALPAMNITSCPASEDNLLHVSKLRIKKLCGSRTTPAEFR